MEYISILPDEIDLAHEHRYLRLPHPRTSQPQLYLPVTRGGQDQILEVVRITGSRRRTWFIGDSTIDNGTILIHHPIDPLFLVIPLILPLLRPSKSDSDQQQQQQQPFQPLSALISTISSSSSHVLPPAFTSRPGTTTAKDEQVVKQGWNEDVGRLLGIKSVQKVFKLCCERKVVPAVPPSPSSLGETHSPKGTAYYRPSLEAIVKIVRAKVDMFAAKEQWECFDHNIRSLGRDGLLLANGVDTDLATSARVKSSIEHFSQYLSPLITALLTSSYDFAALDTHHANMTAAALAASMPPTNLSNKPANENAVAGTKRKSQSSRGVEQLKKVDTKKMAKLTSFFKPKEPTA